MQAVLDYSIDWLTLPMGAAMLRNMSELQTQTPGGEQTANYTHQQTEDSSVAYHTSNRAL